MKVKQFISSIISLILVSIDIALIYRYVQALPNNKLHGLALFLSAPFLLVLGFIGLGLLLSTFVSAFSSMFSKSIPIMLISILIVIIACCLLIFMALYYVNLFKGGIL